MLLRWNNTGALAGPRQARSISSQKWHAAAESLPNAGEPSAAAVSAELQVLLAEIKRLSMHQERMKQEVDSMLAWETEDAAAKSDRHRAAPRLNGCKMTECSGPVLTVPFGRQCTAGSSDWSEASAETPIRNLISGLQSTRSILPDL